MNFFNHRNQNLIKTCFYCSIGIVIFLTHRITSETSTSRTIEEENAQFFHTATVQGEIAELPCNITTPKGDDRISTVIWYKNGVLSPIYTFDARESTDGTHWSDKDILKERALFKTSRIRELAILSIKKTKNFDAGLYRCRVDFHKSPTKNSKVNLTVIIPPENILILDEKGSHIPHYILGPYNEGGSVDLTCVSTGGRPSPQLTWWHDNSILDNTFNSFGERKVKNVLHIEKLQRHHLHAVLTCQASNNNVSTPISSAVTLDMNLRPLWVKLQGENKPLSAEHSYPLSCEVVGSRPKPTVTWWKGSVQMTNTTETTSFEGNITISVLTFTPTIDDSGKFLSCRGEQSLIPDSGLESGWKLDIHHVPVVSLELGSNLNTTFIREGADVYFECNIKSNPWVYKVSWQHNGKFLYSNAMPGIIVANQSLVLQNVSRARSGIYTCIGSNKEGDGDSNQVHLDIKFAPICRPGQVQNYGVARKETAKIICELEANPHDVNFTWRFNSSINPEMMEIPLTSVVVDRAKSIAHYTPYSEEDYGTLLCWGSNEIGAQSEPCIYNINPAGRPDPPSNCTVLNQTVDILQLECLEGFDGGLPQEFIIQVYSSRTKQLIASQTSKIPYFELKGLEPEIGYDIILAAVNKKGKSDLTIHHIHTLNNAEKHTDFLLPYPGSVLHMKLFLGAIAGLIFGIILITVGTLLILRLVRKSSKRKQDKDEQQLNGQPINRRDDFISGTGGVGGGVGILLTNGQSVQITNDGGNVRDSCSGSTDSLEEKNPDIIPQGNEEEKTMKWLNTMQPQNYATLTLSGVQPNTYKLHENSSDYLKQQHALQRTGILITNDNHHPHHQHHQQQINNNPSSYAELSLVLPKQQQQQQQQQQLQHHHQQQQHKTIYTSATLGRPRYKDVRLNEPTIYAQIDLAQHNPLNSNQKIITSYNDTTLTWIPASQGQILRQFHHNEQRTPPIVCTRESMVNSPQPHHPLDHRNPLSNAMQTIPSPITSTSSSTVNSNITGQTSRF